MRAAGLFRRVGAMLYDSLLLTAVLFTATAIALPLNRGEAFSSDNYLFHTYLVAVGFLYFGWFWTHGGQTVGMKAWKLKALTETKQALTWRHASIRCCTAIVSFAAFGSGFLWMLIDKNQRTWHDRLSQSAIFFDPDF